jgi:hypothetical protein
MGLALPFGGANEKLGVLVASGTGELVDRHRCLGVCRSWRGSVVGKQVEEPGDHIIAGNEDAGAKKTEESEVKNFLRACRAEKFRFLFHGTDHEDEIHHEGENRHCNHEPIKFCIHYLVDIQVSDDAP